MTRNGVIHQWATPFIRDVGEFHLGIFTQQCHGQVAQRAVADGAKTHIFL